MANKLESGPDPQGLDPSSDYYGTGANSAFQSILSQVQGVHSDSMTARQNILNNITQAGDQFKTLFSNNVGRDPTASEIDQFFKGSAQTLSDPSMRSGENLRNYTAQFIGDNFQQASQQEAQTKLSDLSTQAGSLADQYTQMGQKSLSDLSNQLQTYQTSLFDKLRPQLNMSAQAQGIADSGGQTLQEQGALRDLGNQATATLLPYAQQVQQNANAIRYGGASAPYSLASSFAAGLPQQTASLGAGGLNFGNTYATNLNNQQLALQLQAAQGLNMQNYWTNTQPSFGANLGKSFGTSLGGNLGDNFNGPNWLAAASGK